MKRLFVALALLGPAAWAAKPAPSKPKIPHSHHSAHGGHVLMFGDDHLELKAAGPNSATVFFSDKFREPLPAGLFRLEAELVEGERRRPVEIKGDEKTPQSVTLVWPGDASPGAKLELRAPRQVLDKGSVSTDRPQTFDLAKLRPTKKP